MVTILKQSDFLHIHKEVCVYQCKNTVTKNNKIKSIIMDISQSYYTLSNKINCEELMLLFNIGLSRLINKHHLISSKSFSPDFTFK